MTTLVSSRNVGNLGMIFVSTLVFAALPIVMLVQSF
jgi:hypothetical protein